MSMVHTIYRHTGRLSKYMKRIIQEEKDYLKRAKRYVLEGKDQRRVDKYKRMIPRLELRQWRYDKRPHIKGLDAHLGRGERRV